MSDDISKRLFQLAQQVIPGGVNSPARAFRAVGTDPVFIKRAYGARIVGQDDTEYLDYVGSWGPAILGHAHPTVIKAVQDTAANGLSFGAPTEAETLFAQAIIERYPSMQMVRCVSSGTESTMSALRVARGFTGRSIVVKFEGCYHGHADHLLVKAGSGLATQGVPSSAGVPEGIAKTTLTLPYNDLGALEHLFEQMPDDIAAVIVEPVVGNMGCVPPVDGFLAGLIGLCTRYGALSIFDEVMTGCRLSAGGAQGLWGLKPDLTCLGKVVGGGMPLAAYGGRRDVMSVIAPLGPVYQAGTLSGNPVAVACGLATLKLLEPSFYEYLERLSAQLEQGLRQAVESSKVTACVQRVGSMITLFFSEGPVRNWQDASRSDTKKFALWHQAMLARGVYWPPSQFEAAFVGGAHTRDDIARTVEAAEQSLKLI
jgi:glutamate-1-semialdehyde 2,1-aminomutase